MKKIAPFVALLMLAAACATTARSTGPIVLGAVYPTAGGQGPGGLDEWHGVQLAAEYVDDVYGQGVSSGMIDQINAMHLPLVGTFRYNLQTVRFPDLVQRIRAARVQILLVVAYMDDGIGLRKEMVKQRVPLVASIGT